MNLSIKKILFFLSIIKKKCSTPNAQETLIEEGDKSNKEGTQIEHKDPFDLILFPSIIKIL
jgi:hypothetical protein